MMLATELPFATPGMVLLDAIRLYCVVGGIVVTLGMVAQFIAHQPGISVRLQRARATFIFGTVLLLAADISVELERFGKPPLVFRLSCITVGVTVMIVWIVLEQIARHRDPEDRLTAIRQRGA
jgi:hypothetical protein